MVTKWQREERAVKCVNSIDPQNLMLVDYATYLFSLFYFYTSLIYSLSLLFN
ncbi:unnamed protein product [Brassica oleracea]